MASLYAFCGLDCASCEAFIVTQANDEAGQLDLLARWQADYHSPDMTIAAVTCDGCTSSGRLGGYCMECPVRACGWEKGMENCAHCDGYETCETLQGFIADIPVARENLNQIRLGL
jgi:hypothetical protein